MQREEEVLTSTAEPQASVVTLHLLMTVGRMIGLSVLPPYYSLRLLPYLVPHLLPQEQQLHVERDCFTGDAEADEVNLPESNPP